MAILQTKWIDVGSANFYGTVVTGLLATGTLSNTQNGSSDINLDSVYSGADVTTLTHATSSGGYVTFSLTGNRANGVFDTLKIGGVSFARTAATYSYNSSSNRARSHRSSSSSSSSSSSHDERDPTNKLIPGQPPPSPDNLPDAKPRVRL